MAEQSNKQKELLDPRSAGFVEKITQRVPDFDLFLFECPTCKGKHFAHLGHVEVMIGFLEAGGEKEIRIESEPVKVCVTCKSCFVWTGNQMYDVTGQVDLKAWGKLEK